MFVRVIHFFGFTARKKKIMDLYVVEIVGISSIAYC